MQNDVKMLFPTLDEDAIHAIAHLDSRKPKWHDITRIFPPYFSNSSDTVLGFDIYGKYSDEKWFHWTILLYKKLVLDPIDSVYWWIRYRTFSRYHTLKIMNVKPGWNDIDYMMFHACFTLLGRFVEGELGILKLDGTTTNHYRGYRLHSVEGFDEKAIDLWLWYKLELPKLIEEENEYLDNKKWKEYNNKYGYLYVEKIQNEKMDELMKIRKWLWT